MSIDPQIVEILKKLEGLPATHTLEPDAARAQYMALVQARAAPGADVGDLSLRTIPGPAGDIPVRVYTPAGGQGNWPLLMYYHGGGHVFGNPETHDVPARNLCAGASCVVVSVDYRKAPEHKFPAAAEDAFAALAWCAEHADELRIDPSRIAVGGDSAGGNLAAVCALMARDAGAPALAFQLLVYPVADYRCQSGSYERYATGYGSLLAETMRWFQGHYLNGAEDASDWRASPLLAPDLGGLPPALVIAAQYDVLHDEDVALAQALEAAGNDVEFREYAGMIHGFFAMTPTVDRAVDAQRDAVAALKSAFG